MTDTQHTDRATQCKLDLYDLSTRAGMTAKKVRMKMATLGYTAAEVAKAAEDLA